MENASKALLFAAGILIAIILISVAVYLVNMSQDATKGVGSAMTEMELMQFNQKFTTYEGVRTGSQVKQLITTVNSSNVDNAGTDLLVTVELGTGIDAKYLTGDTTGNYKFDGGNAKKYQVEITPYNQDGAVKKIVIKGTSGTSGS